MNNNPPKNHLSVEILEAPVKAAKDKKKYKSIKLKNGLTVLMISDTSSDLHELEKERKPLHGQAKKNTTSSKNSPRKGFQNLVKPTQSCFGGDKILNRIDNENDKRQ